MMYRARRLFIGIFSCMSDDFIGQNNIDIINKNLLTFLAFHIRKILLFRYYNKCFAH